MKRVSVSILATALAVVAATALFRAFAQPPLGLPFQQKERHAEGGEPPASPFNARQAVIVSTAAQARAGIRSVALEGVSARKRITAPAVVLSAQNLAVLRGAYIAARAKLETSQINLDVAQKEYARAKSLYQDNQNVSEKVFQAAQGALRDDRIDVRAAQIQVSLQAGLVRQSWGPVAAKWVETASPALDRVLSQDAYLVQVSLPPEASVSAPSTVWLAVPGGKQMRANLLSPFPRVDPRVQGASWLYLTPAGTGLAPGLTLVAELPVGRQIRGVVVPASAVVWSEGESWFYEQIAPTRFVRRPLLSDFPFGGGYFVTRGIPPGARVVVAGAETLLSEELSPRGPTQPAGDEDDD
jgi:multidrug efflux system membrane fusion protein